MLNLRFPTLPMVAVASLALLATDVMAQPGGRGGRAARGGQAGGGLQMLLMREDVQRELEVTDDQIEELRELGRSGGERMDRQQLREEMEGLSDEERREKLQDLRQNRMEESKARLKEVLLPEQIERLDQLAAQFAMRAGGQAMFRGQLAEQLGITDDQREELQKKAEELQQEFNKKMQQLRQEMQEKLLDQLSAEQRKKYRDMVGEAFEFQQPERGAFGRGVEGGRGRGGRGGRSGRGQGGDNDF